MKLSVEYRYLESGLLITVRAPQNVFGEHSVVVHGLSTYAQFSREVPPLPTQEQIREIAKWATGVVQDVVRQLREREMAIASMNAAIAALPSEIEV